MSEIQTHNSNHQSVRDIANVNYATLKLKTVPCQLELGLFYNHKHQPSHSFIKFTLQLNYFLIL